MNVNDDGDEDDVESTYRMMTRKGVAGSERLCVGEKERKKERKEGKERERERKEENVYVCACV